MLLNRRGVNGGMGEGRKMSHIHSDRDRERGAQTPTAILRVGVRMAVKSREA